MPRRTPLSILIKTRTRAKDKAADAGRNAASRSRSCVVASMIRAARPMTTSVRTTTRPTPKARSRAGIPATAFMLAVELVADAPDRLDEAGAQRVRFDLLAQAAD